MLLALLGCSLAHCRHLTWLFLPCFFVAVDACTVVTLASRTRSPPCCFATALSTHSWTSQESLYVSASFFLLLHRAPLAISASHCLSFSFYPSPFCCTLLSPFSSSLAWPVDPFASHVCSVGVRESAACLSLVCSALLHGRTPFLLTKKSDLSHIQFIIHSINLTNLAIGQSSVSPAFRSCFISAVFLTVCPWVSFGGWAGFSPSLLSERAGVKEIATFWGDANISGVSLDAPFEVGN